MSVGAQEVNRSVVEAAVKDEMARRRAMTNAFSIYENGLPDPIKKTPRKDGTVIDDNVKRNLPKLLVNKGAAFLYGEDVAFEVPDSDTTGAAMQEWLDTVWLRNRKMTRLQKFGISTGIAGHGFIKITIKDGWPRLVLLDPQMWRAVWEEDDIEEVYGYRGEWTVIRNGTAIRKRQLVDRADNGQSWTIQDKVESNGVFIDAREPETWPYPFAPIVDCQNLPLANCFYGQSDLETDVLEIAKSINRTLSNTGRILRNHAHPKTVAKGMKAQDLVVGVDGVLFIPTEADLKNLEMQSDLASSIAFYERLVEAFFEQGQIPEVARGKMDGAGQLSGVALKILYQPIIEKTQAKRRLQGDMLSELNRRLLIVGGKGNDIEVTNNWHEVVPTDPASDAQTALDLKAVGVSTATVLARLGFNAEEEATKKATEPAAMGIAALQGFNAGNPDDPASQQ